MYTQKTAKGKAPVWGGGNHIHKLGVGLKGGERNDKGHRGGGS